jgi:hypothetical protein
VAQSVIAELPQKIEKHRPLPSMTSGVASTIQDGLSRLGPTQREDPYPQGVPLSSRGCG